MYAVDQGKEHWLVGTGRKSIDKMFSSFRPQIATKICRWNYFDSVDHFPVVIPDVYPGSRILIFTHSDPGSKNSNKREGWKKLVVKPFL